MNERTTGIYRSYEGWVVLWFALVESNDEALCLHGGIGCYMFECGILM